MPHFLVREGVTESRQVFLLPFGTPTTTVAETPHPVVAIISPTPTMVTKMHRNQTPTNCAVARCIYHDYKVGASFFLCIPSRCMRVF